MYVGGCKRRLAQLPFEGERYYRLLCTLHTRGGKREE
jgi:hypothetical protein